MKAVTVAAGTAGSVRLEDVPEQDAALGSVVVGAPAARICGTDAEIASGSYGWPPPGRDRLILGYESLGRVIAPGPKVLAAADRSWLEQLVTRRVRADQVPQALEREPDDIKVVTEFAQP